MDNQNLEPAAEDVLRTGDKANSLLSVVPPLYSIAISLKRIADAIEGRPDKMGMVDAIATAIEQGILSAARQR